MDIKISLFIITFFKMTLNLEFSYKEDLKTKQNIKIDILNIYKNLKN
jgi:hypothetical protein